MNNSSELFNQQLDDSRDHAVVCRPVRIDINSRLPIPAVEIYFEPVSDESEIVQRNQDRFMNAGLADVPVYKTFGIEILKLVERFPDLCPECDFERAETDLEYQKAIVEETLNGKLAVVNPSYNMTEKGPLYTKKLYVYGQSIVKVVNDVFPDDEFTIVPSIIKADPIEQRTTLEKLLKHQPITLVNWDTTIFGVPHYLDFGNKFVHAEFQAANTSNAIQLKSDSTPILCGYQTIPLVNEGKLITTDSGSGYRFFATHALAEMVKNAMDAIKHLKNENPVPNETVNQDSDDSEAEAPEFVQRENTALANFRDYMRSAQLEYTTNDINNFHACIKSGILTILAGMSGTGKTRLPLEYAKFFGMSEKDYTLLFLPISPSYTEPNDILGFYNPVDHSYLPSETGLVDFLVHAQNNPSKAHMVIFEEMNLAQIEHWFAPFLSILEKDANERELRLYSDNLKCNNSDKYPAVIHVGTNVIFVGTINIDETTTKLSDRLLDRSFVINLEKLSFARYSNNPTDNKAVSNKNYTPEKLMEILGSRDYTEFNYINTFSSTQIAFFDELHNLLHDADPTGGVSFRTVKNIAVYLKNCPITDSFNASKSFDYAVCQTILKKVRGPEEILSKLLSDDEGSLKALLTKYSSISGFELCIKEIANKRKQLARYGFIR